VPIPVPWVALAAAALLFVAGIAFLLSRRVPVTHTPVALMVTRIGFPANLRLHDVDGALKMLELRDEIVIPFPRATLIIDFPLTHAAHIGITAALPQGFTRGELVQAICEEYAHVYAAEEGTATNAELKVEERGARRERNRTDGAYGIWGHELDDLVLSSARWVKQSNGDVKVELHVVARPTPPLTALPSA
jgi:hypothetical protein